MKAIMWKEFRENNTWAALALIVIGFCDAFGCYSLRNEITQGLWLARVDVLPFSSIFLAPVAGALMGAVQILPELRRDQWAFLFHRPLSPSGIFWSKTAAGLLMLLAAIALPDITTFFWLRSRSPIPELLRWELLQPSFVSFLAGAMFYFAAMLAALRPARWYGSRLLSLPVAAVLAVLCFYVPQFWQAVLIGLAGTALLATAAVGCFQAKGEYVPMPAFSKPALAIVMTAGPAIAVLFVTPMVTAMIESSWQYRQSLSTPQYNLPVTFDENYRMDKQGRVLRVRLTWPRNRQNIEVKGRTFPDSKEISFAPTRDPGKYFQDMIPLVLNRAFPFINSRLPSYSTQQYISPRSLYGLIRDDREQLCFYDFREQRIVYYVSKEHRVTGYLGPAGYYAAGSQPPAQGAFFPGRLYSEPTGQVYWFKHDVFWVEPGKRQVSRLAHTSPGEPIYSALPLGGAKDTSQPTRQQMKLYLVTPHDIRIADGAGREIARTKLDEKDAQSEFIHVAPLDNSTQNYWLADISHSFAGRHTLHSTILETAADGREIRRFALPDLSMDRSTSPAPSEIIWAIALPCWRPDNRTLSTQAPDPAWDVAIFGYSERWLTPAVPIFVPLCMAIFSAIATFFLTGLLGVARLERWIWVALALPLGLIAPLGLICVRSRPTRIPCPSCRSPRSVSSEQCRHCGAGWNKPDQDGTEILVHNGALPAAPGGLV